MAKQNHIDKEGYMSQETSIVGTFIWTFEDAIIRGEVLAGRQVAIARKIATWFTFAFIAGMALVTFIFSITNKGSLSFKDLIFIYSLLGSTPILYLFFSYIQKANFKKVFLQNPDSNKHVEVKFTHDEIIMKAESIHESKWSWNTIKEIQQNPKGFCFFLAEKSGFWIPIRAFQSQADIDALTELAKQLTPKFNVSA